MIDHLRQLDIPSTSLSERKPLLRNWNMSFCLIASILLVYGFGWDLSTDSGAWVFHGIHVCMAAIILAYLVKVSFYPIPWQYLTKTPIEALLLMLATASVFLHFLAGDSVLPLLLSYIGFKNPVVGEQVLVCMLLFVVLLQQSWKFSGYLLNVHFRPNKALVLSYVSLAISGTVFLSLPAATYEKHYSWIYAFFQATAALTQTGMSLVDIQAFYTIKGQIVLLALMQIGGLMYVFFATFFLRYMAMATTDYRRALSQKYINAEMVDEAAGLFQRIAAFVIISEMLGAVYIYFVSQGHLDFDSYGQALFFSVFHAVSAFCNVGLTTLPKGLSHPELIDAYALQGGIATLAMIGGMGYPVFEEVRRYLKKKLVGVKQYMTLSLDTKYSIVTSLIFLFAAIGFYFILERGKSLLGAGVWAALLNTLVQITGARSSGFYLVAPHDLGAAPLFLLTLVMFIGGTPASMAGGIKTSTAALLGIAMLNTLSGKRYVELAKRTIVYDFLFKSFIIITFAAGYNFIMTLFLLALEPGTILQDVLFDQISAYFSSGLSTGAVKGFSRFSIFLLAITCLVGKTASLVLVMAVTNRNRRVDHKYPVGTISIG